MKTATMAAMTEFPINWECAAGGFVEPGCTVAKTARVRTPATLYDGAEVYGRSRIEGKSTTRDDVRFIGSPIFYNSHAVGGPVIVADRSVIVDSAAVGDVMFTDDCYCDHSFFRGRNVRISGNAIVENVKVDGTNIQIQGGIVRDCILRDNVKIVSGTWTRSPRSIVTEKYLVCEMGDGKIGLDCKIFDGQFWLAKGPEIGRSIGLSESQIEEIRQAIIMVLG